MTPLTSSPQEARVAENNEAKRRRVDVGKSSRRAIMGTGRSGLALTTAAVGDSRVLTVYGVLDDTTYVRVRDAIIAAASDDRSLVIDITKLRVTTVSGWAAFNGARLHLGHRCEVAMALVCDTAEGLKALRSNGINQDIPVYWRLQAAVAALAAAHEKTYRARKYTEKPTQRDWLECWPTIPLRTGAGYRGQLLESR